MTDANPTEEVFYAFAMERSAPGHKAELRRIPGIFFDRSLAALAVHEYIHEHSDSVCNGQICKAGFVMDPSKPGDHEFRAFALECSANADCCIWQQIPGLFNNHTAAAKAAYRYVLDRVGSGRLLAAIS